MNEAVIKFEEVWKYYPLYHYITGGFKTFIFNLPKFIKQMHSNKFLALKNISFEIQRGETFGIIGKNGAGKSTILGLIAEVMKPSSGKIVVNGRVSPLLELGAGFHSALTGRENIMLNGLILGLDKKTVLNKTDEIIAFSELGDLIEHPIRIYSSGMLTRLGFSIVVHLAPEILLIDEILTAVGDIDFQKKCLNKIKEFQKNNAKLTL